MDQEEILSLQIGDIIKFQKEFAKVYGIVFSKDKFRVHVKIGDSIIVANSLDIERVYLSETILYKNGFHKMDDYHFVGRGLIIATTNENTLRRRGYVFNNIVFESVDELQKIFRMIGLKIVANNFEI